MTILTASTAQTTDSAKQSQQEDKEQALAQCLDDSLSRLSAEQIFNHPIHNFQRSGERLRGSCPFHASKSGSSFVVSDPQMLFWCEGCQTGGSPADYRASLRAGRWVKARSLDFVEAVRELAADANVPFPEKEKSPEEIAKSQKWEKRREILAATHERCQQVLWSDHKDALEARRYLVEDRGLTEEEIKQLPIGFYSSQQEMKEYLSSKGFTPEEWKGTGCVWKGFEGYITFLWNDSTGRPLTIYGRYYKQHPPEGKPKTIAAPGDKTKQSPMYFDRVIKAGHKEAVLVEGVLDAVLLQAKGDTRVCAYVAASCSNAQIETLKRKGFKAVTLCGDPDAGGENGTNSNLLRLSKAGIKAYIAPKLPDDLDPDEFLVREGLDGWKNHIDNAEHSFAWKARRILETGNINTDKGKIAILEQAEKFTKNIGEEHSDLKLFFWPSIHNGLRIESIEKLEEELVPIGESRQLPEEENQQNIVDKASIETEEDSGIILKAIEEAAQADKVFFDNLLKQSAKKIKKAFCQIIYDNLFKDKNYIYVFHQFYEWKDTHYEPMAIEVITKQIHDYCDTYAVPSKKEITYPYAAPGFVTMGLNWLKQKFGIDPKLVNPPGLNCIDGILQLSFDPDSKKLIKTLVPHDPSFYYLYAPQATYHISPILIPDACNQLLSCLDAPQRDIFLKTIGAAFDLPTVRRYKGRAVKGLLLHGTGSNGKDTLRYVTSMMFGYRGMVSVSFTDFMQYDQARKFPVQKLDGAQVNWPSENGDDVTLDKIQSLKCAITGDPLSGEKKGKDEYEFIPKCVNLFNYNVPPKLQGSMQAIRDRFAILKFTKTYKTNPAPGELQADSRFHYDPEFVRTDVLPWYLYYCLDALERLMKEGINYEVTEQAWENLRAESDHVYAFCQEVGIGYKRSGQLGTDEVYEALREWYINNGTLQVVPTLGEHTRDVWSGNPAWGDSLIKGKNQIFNRLLKIFPEARRERDSSGRSVLVGIGWLSPTHTDGESVSECYSSEDGLKQSEDGLKMLHPLQNQHSEATEAVLAVRGENQKIKIEETCGCGGQCPACFAESAKNLANAMLRCESGTAVQELLAQYDHLSEAAWRSLTEDGHDYVRNLLFESEMEEPELKTQNYKEESPPPNHLQQLQNADSVRVEASSDHLQTASDHLQNCSDSIQNPPREEEVNYALEVTDAVDNANELKPLSQEYAIDFGDGQIAYSYIFIQRKGNICQFEGMEEETIELLVDEDGKFVENVAVKKME